MALSDLTISFSPFDLHFAEFISKLNKDDDNIIFISTALVSFVLRNGHVCLDLKSSDFSKYRFENLPFDLRCPPAYEQWTSHLEKSEVVGKPGDFKPLILENGRLYLYRYWKYEQDLSDFLLQRSSNSIAPEITTAKKAILSLFPDDTEDINWQFIAAVMGINNRCTVISGGPGTGKTTTVAKIIALYFTIYGTDKHVAFAAPTGKAASRLCTSLSQVVTTLPCSEDIKKSVPRDVLTLHRLLGTRPHSPDFTYNATNPLPYDLVIIDEASMVDLSLMSKLAAAIRPECRIILIGDKDQLSSVEAGAVLGDICDTGNSHKYTDDYSSGLRYFFQGIPSPDKDEPDFSNSIVTLRKSYRFTKTSAIGQLAGAINSGKPDDALSILLENDSACKIKMLPSKIDWYKLLSPCADEYFIPLSRVENIYEGFEILDSFRILCAVRQGPFGIETLNSCISSIVNSSQNTTADLYHGKPILVTGNDYTLNLYNGDTGIIMKDHNPESGTRVYFQGATTTTSRALLPRQIKLWEDAYALTVHKSQGSEFDRVLLILPSSDNPVLTRELLYTAVTRAKKEVEIWSTPEILKICIERRIVRRSGLREKLWGSSSVQ